MSDRVIDRDYRIIETLGEGSYGIVHLCEDIGLERRVAVKVLRPEQASQLERLKREARILAAIEHSNVVKTFRLGTENDLPYIVMEYVDGQTLQAMLEARRPTLAEGVHVMLQVARGLGAVHERGIVHRDLSAKNVMVNRDGVVKVLDLGLARDLQAISQDEYLAGTFPYVSPEQVKGETVSTLSDVFSFGTLLYEVLTGVNPFLGDRAVSTLYNIVHREPSALSEYIQNAPGALIDLVNRCLDKNPESRLQSIEAAAEILEALEGDASLASTVTFPPGDTGRRRDNPYLCRSAIRNPREFVGRRHALHFVFERLNADTPQSVSIVGDMRSGKSSLLNAIYSRHFRAQYLTAPDRMIMVFIDLQGQKLDLAGFVRLLLDMVQLELRGRVDISSCTCDLDGIKSLVSLLGKGGFKLAILFDEFGAITQNASFELDFFAFMRALANQYDVAYVTASSSDLQTLCHTKAVSDSPFFNIFSVIRLAAFSLEEAEYLIREPSHAAGRPLAQYTDQILSLAGRMPFYLQIACAHAFDSLASRSGSEQPDFDAIRHGFYEEARFHYRFILDHLDERQRSVVIKLARGKSVPESQKFIVRELISRSLVEDDALFAEPFAQFVNEEMERRNTGGWLGRLFRRG